MTQSTDTVAKKKNSGQNFNSVT